MTNALLHYRLADLRHRVSRAWLLADLAGKVDDDAFADLQTFAREIGDEAVADNLAAFRQAQDDALLAAQTELDLLIEPDGGTS